MIYLAGPVNPVILSIITSVHFSEKIHNTLKIFPASCRIVPAFELQGVRYVFKEFRFLIVTRVLHSASLG